jgi:N-acetylglucosaminyldiphosphoundecaprenol N-acetyl-beta-D-mannosaminyltransferase
LFNARVHIGARALLHHAQELEEPTDMAMHALLDKPEERFVAPTRNLFGFNFVSDHDVTNVVDRITGPQPSDELLPFVLTPNVDYIVRLRESRHADLAEVLPRARYVLPDGQPIVWTSRFTGEPLPARLPGSTMFPVMWKRVVDERRPTVVIASNDRTAAALRREYPEAGVVVPHHFNADDRTEVATVAAQVVDSIRATDAEFVFVGISFPKQQRVALAAMDTLRAAGERVPLFLLLGGSFEMYLGEVKRAPTWVQKSGLEWLFRFIQEPRRLFKRYFVTDTRFILLLVQELVRCRTYRGSQFL